MVRNLTEKGFNIGSEVRILNGDLEAVTPSAGTWTPIWKQQSTKSVKYAHGHGVSNRDGNAGFGDLDLQHAAGALDGELRFEVYNDANMDDLIAISGVYRTENLRAAVSDSRTEKPMFPLLAPGAPDEGYLVLAYKPDAGSAGTAVDPAASNVGVGIPYTRFQA